MYKIHCREEIFHILNNVKRGEFLLLKMYHFFFKCNIFIKNGSAFIVKKILSMKMESFLLLKKCIIKNGSIIIILLLKIEA